MKWWRWVDLKPITVLGKPYGSLEVGPSTLDLTRGGRKGKYIRHLVYTRRRRHDVLQMEGDAIW